MNTVRSRVKRLVPPIAWRDDKLAERAEEVRRLRRELQQARTALRSTDVRDDLAELGGSLERASMLRSLADLRRSVVSLRAIDLEKAHPLRQLPFKLRNYRLAMSHGIAVPTVYRAWPAIEAIDLADLPESFVLKSDGGAGGHGVLPLRRRADGRFDLVNTDTTLSESDIRSRLGAVKSLSGPHFAEELLRGTAGSPIPEDVKVYAGSSQLRV